MRVHVYLELDGGMVALVEPSPGKGRSPVIVTGLTPGNTVEKVLPVVEEMRKPKTPREGRSSL